MAGTCTVCAHPERKAIDEALIVGTPLREITRRWGVSKDAASRHRKHVSPALSRVVSRRRADAGPRSALDRLEELYGRANVVLTAAEREGQASLSLAAIRELRSIVEMLAKITGELDDRPQVNVLSVHATPEWLATRDAMLGALAPYPEAAQAVAARLQGIEAPR